MKSLLAGVAAVLFFSLLFSFSSRNAIAQEKDADKPLAGPVAPQDKKQQSKKEAKNEPKKEEKGGEKKDDARQEK